MNDQDTAPVGKEAVRQYLEGILDSQDIATLDQLVAQLGESPPLEQRGGEESSGRTAADDIREFLEDRLNPEEMEMLQHLVGEIELGAKR